MILSILLSVASIRYQIIHSHAFCFGPSSQSLTSLPASQQHHATSTPAPPPPISVPVWSLTSPISGTPASSMSIVTFATPVSSSPPKLWAVSLYKTSFTRCAFLGLERSGEEYNHESVKDVKGVGILQLMTPGQSKLVPILGKRTGWDKTHCKKTECSRELGLNGGWVTVSGSVVSPKESTFEVLPRCAYYIQLKLRQITDGGDHDVAICEAIGSGVWNDNDNTIQWLTAEDNVDGRSVFDPSSVLYSGLLRKEGII